MLVWGSSAVQKIKKLSETPVTVHNIAKLCVIDGKNREIILDPFWAFWGVPKMALYFFGHFPIEIPMGPAGVRRDWLN